MNSYELDQPLDLRLKALNLSRTLQHDLQHHIHPAHNLAMVNNLMISPYGNGSSSCGNLLLTNYYGSQCAAPGPRFDDQQVPGERAPQQVASSVSILNPPPPFCSHNSRLSYPLTDPAPAGPFETNVVSQAAASHQLCTSKPPQSHNNPVQGQSASHNVHGAPRSSHQHHSLGRLAVPPPLVNQSHSPVAKAPSSAPHLGSNSSSSSEILANMPPVCQGNHIHRLSQAPIASSLQNLAHQNSALKHRQMSPPPQQQQQQLCQPVLPVRSLSMSGQMLTPSHLSLMVSPTPPPPTSAATPSATCVVSQHNRQSVGGHSPGARTANSGDSDTNSGTINCHSRNNTVSEMVSTRLTSPSTSHQSAAPVQMSGSCQQQQQSVNQSPMGSPTNNETRADGSTSPIMRQHSLVSRYNCKPCGIVFSQPETLRAHQEGYCTKTNRAQLRSQSAVSPSTLQQSTILSNNSSGR